MQAVRTVFNIAVGGGNQDIRTTARSALLQMLNTIVKRVSQQIMVRWCFKYSHLIAIRMRVFMFTSLSRCIIVIFLKI